MTLVRDEQGRANPVLEGQVQGLSVLQGNTHLGFSWGSPGVLPGKAQNLAEFQHSWIGLTHQGSSDPVLEGWIVARICILPGRNCFHQGNGTLGEGVQAWLGSGPQGLDLPAPGLERATDCPSVCHPSTHPSSIHLRSRTWEVDQCGTFRGFSLQLFVVLLNCSTCGLELF